MPSMAEIVSRFLFSVLLTVVVMPICLLVFTPWILIRAYFDDARFRQVAKRMYLDLIRKCLNFGTDFIQP
jgi:hypothetical protein